MANGPHYPKGRYIAEVVEQALGKAKTGTVQFVLKVRILECLTPRGPVENQYDRTIFLAITDKTMEYVIPKLQGIGYTRDSLKYLDPNTSNFHSFVGQEIEVFCNHENGQDGQLREKWDVALQGSKPLDVAPADPASIRSLDLLFGRALKQTKATTSQPVQTRAAAAVADDLGVSDDDVPF